MNPQSSSFVPQDDSYWRLSNTMRVLQDVQEQHSERIRNLERRQDEESRVKSLWGPASPFPNAMGTPNHGPIQAPAAADFPGFDDDAQSANMVRSLQLDADEEPRRMGATSRANSVRFDESANQGASQWSAHHSNRASGDFLQRSSSGMSGLGGHPLFERSGSHKSEGKQSSVGHSLGAGRSNSFGLGLDSLRSVEDHPGIAPFLSIIGSPPAIVRCWLNMSFTSASILYAAVCTGSYKSFLDIHLIFELGYGSHIQEDISGERKIKLPVYFPEAKSAFASSRGSSPAPALPSLNVDFTVLDKDPDRVPGHTKGIRVFIGSDTLRAHNADILFSADLLVAYDGDRNKLTIPLARPEDESVYKSLRIADGQGAIETAATVSDYESSLADLQPLSNGLLEHHQDGARLDSQERQSMDSEGQSKSDIMLRHPSLRNPSAQPDLERNAEEDTSSNKILAHISTTRADEASNSHNDSPPLASALRASSSPAVWSNWRREATNTAHTSDWSSATRLGRSASGIKVLKPTRQVSRSSGPSTTATVAPHNNSYTPNSSLSTASTRPGEDGKKRLAGNVDNGGDSKYVIAREGSAKEVKDDKTIGGSGKPTRKVNPIGGASAFSWMNSASK